MVNYSGLRAARTRIVAQSVYAQRKVLREQQTPAQNERMPHMYISTSPLSACANIVRNHRRLVRYLFCAMSIIFLPTAAHAHAQLEKSEPAADSIVTSPPTKVTLYFNRPMETSFSKVSVYDTNNKQVDKGNSKVIGENNVIFVEVPSLSSGAYLVRYSIVAKDGHKMKGEFNFSVKP